MSADDDQRSARETLSKIADELQARPGETALKLIAEWPAPSAVQSPPPSVEQTSAPHATEAAQAGADKTRTQTDAEAFASPGEKAPTPSAEGAATRSTGKTAKPTIVETGARRRNAPEMRSALVTYFPMLIAVVALASSIYQGYLFHASLDIMQRNVSRGEYFRTCREIIETYFQVKQKVGVLMPAADRGNVVGASRVSENNRIEVQGAVAKFGGLGTYLANFQDAGTRARYTELTRTLVKIVDAARATPLTDIDKLFEPADKLFAQMNDDCVTLSKTTRM